MHSRIIGITEKQYFDTHQDEHDWELNYDYDVPDFADYTSTDTDLADDFEWLVKCLIHDTDASLLDVNMNELTIKFKPGFKERYFKPKWDKLLKQVLGNPAAFDQFCGLSKNSNDIMYDVKKCIDEEYGFYIADEYGSWETLDSFIREIDYDKTYKCFDSVDYHY